MDRGTQEGEKNEWGLGKEAGRMEGWNKEGGGDNGVVRDDWQNYNPWLKMAAVHFKEVLL